MWLYFSKTRFTEIGGRLYLAYGLYFAKFFLELNYTIFKIKRLLDGFSRRFNALEDKISEPKDRVINKSTECKRE